MADSATFGGGAGPAPTRSYTPDRTLTFGGSWSPVDEMSHRWSRSPAWVRRLGTILLVMVIALPFILLFAPWQQTIAGSGRVVAFSPLDREQVVEAPISGRVTEVWVVEGTPVKKGDPLFELTDIDDQRIQRLEIQLTALRTKLEAFEAQAEQYRMNIDNTRSIGELTVQANEAKVSQAEQKVTAAEADLEGADAELLAAKNQVERKRRLYESGTGAVSLRQLEIAEADYGVAVSKVESARAKLDGARADLLGAQQELERARVDINAKVASARAILEEANSKVAETAESIAKMEGDLNRQQAQLVTAPRDGIVHRVRGAIGGTIVKASDPMIVLVPDTDTRSVEILIDGNDAPLIRNEAEVRIQFEGWPAVQFPGAPELMFGVFDGRVALVDPTDDGNGQFRILVTPVGEWPPAKYLRQGVRAKAWVLLREVPVWNELWRQLNGFPPIVPLEEPEGVARKRLK